MRALWNNMEIAKSDKTIEIEGNHYFPPHSIKKEYLRSSSYKTTCYWKGVASYYNIVIDGKTNQNAAWTYHKPTKTSIKIVGSDYTDYIAFWRGVEVMK